MFLLCLLSCDDLHMLALFIQCGRCGGVMISLFPSLPSPPSLSLSVSVSLPSVELPPSGPLLRSYDGIHNLSEGYIPGAVEEEELTRETESEISNADHSQLPPRSRLQTLEVQ